MQVNLSTAGKAFQTVDSDLFYVQLDLSSNDTNFNNTHPRLQVKQCWQVLGMLLCITAASCVELWLSMTGLAFVAKLQTLIMQNPFASAALKQTTDSN